MLITELPLEFRPFPAKVVIDALLKFKESDASIHIERNSEIVEISDYTQGTNGTMLWIENDSEPTVHQDNTTIFIDITTISQKCLSLLQAYQRSVREETVTD